MQSFELLVLQSQSIDRPLEERHAAFGELVHRFQDLAFSQAFERLGDLDLSQDIAQESFLTAYKKLAQLQHPRAFPSWLRRIVLTHCDRITRRKQHPTDCIDDFEHLADGRSCPATEAEQRDLREKILAAISELPEHERIVTQLYYLDGYAQSDISEMVGIPVKTVKSRLYSSRQRLQERLHRLLKEGKARAQKQPSEKVQVAPVAKSSGERQAEYTTVSFASAGPTDRNLLDNILECERLRIHIARRLQAPCQEPILIEVPATQPYSEPQPFQFGTPTTVLPSC